LYCAIRVRHILVNGEIYQQIVRNKDLVADILPPPAFVIESYATAMDLLEERDPSALRDGIEKLKSLHKDYEERQAFWTAAPLSAGDKEMLTVRSAGPARAFFETVFASFLPALSAGDRAGATAIFRNTLRPDYIAHRAVIERLAGQVDAEVADIERQTARKISEIVWSVLGLAGLATLLALGISLYVARQITRPMSRLVQFSVKTAQGVFDEQLDIAQQDEIGVLAANLGVMVGNITRLIAEARSKSEEARAEAATALQCRTDAEGARESVLRKQESLLATANRLAQVAVAVEQAGGVLSQLVTESDTGAKKQSSQLGETATAMEQMNATVLEVARNASQASTTVKEARDKASDGARVVADVVVGIEGVQALAETLKTDMTSLGQQAEGIGRIIGVIGDIADQTNLLALNAAIEAARAGDAGRGFAVVADAVRKLAEKTMAATREVGEAVGAIQTESKKDIDHVQQAVGGIQAATGLARRSGQALEEIVGLVDMAAGQSLSIATASEQQSAASEQINRAIDGINRISSETEQAMCRALTSLADLRDQSHVLTGLIDDMRCQGGADAPPAALPAEASTAGSGRRPGLPAALGRGGSRGLAIRA